MLVLLSNICYSQKNFLWEKVDSVLKNKNQIYSDTKIFISEKWKSAQNVIQNDDKENGMILVKGASKKVSSGGAIFVYSYTFKFYMKDNKYKIVIDNVKFESGTFEKYDYLILDPQDEFPGVVKAGLYKKDWENIMKSLKTDLDSVVSQYEIFIKKPSTSSDW